MGKAIVGYTGFVGSNICARADFDQKYNSKNIEEAFGTRPEFLVYAGVRAEKYLANHDPEKDRLQTEEAFDNICRIAPEKLVLISTSDVYKVPLGVDENTAIETESLHAYGLNRYLLEEKVREKYADAVIIRLPALFGKGIKKNFIYDYINRIPSMLTEQKLCELTGKDDFITPYYEDQGNGFYKCRFSTEEERKALKDYFSRIGFSALQFTDSRSQFQFYPLDRLWKDIQNVVEKDIRLVNIVTEPVTAGEVYRSVCGQEFVNELAKPPALYDIHSVYSETLGGSGAYLMDRNAVLQELKRFIEENDR